MEKYGVNPGTRVARRCVGLVARDWDDWDDVKFRRGRFECWILSGAGRDDFRVMRF